MIMPSCYSKILNNILQKQYKSLHSLIKLNLNVLVVDSVQLQIFYFWDPRNNLLARKNIFPAHLSSPRDALIVSSSGSNYIT